MMTLWLLAALMSPPTGPDGANALSRMRARQEAIRTISAKIEQVKSYPQLGIDDPVERGMLYLERGRDGNTSVRLEIASPESRILVARRGKYLLYQPRIKQAVEGLLESGAKKSLFSGILTGSREAAGQLERDYLEQEPEPGHLRFVAKPGAAVHCQTIELWLEGDGPLPTKQSCHEANQSVITIRVDEVVLDGELPDGIFELEIPAGVERVKG